MYVKENSHEFAIAREIKISFAELAYPNIYCRENFPDNRLFPVNVYPLLYVLINFSYP